MTPRFSLLLASTALTLALGLPSLAAMNTPGQAQGQCSGVCAAVFGGDDGPMPLIRISGDDEDEDDDDGGWFRRGPDDDEDDDDEEDDDEDCEDEDEDEDEDDCPGAVGNPAPAGTVAPPANGLFGTGKPPVAVTN